jgi:YD repeat-containing protein
VQVLGYDKVNRVTSRTHVDKSGVTVRFTKWAFDRIAGAPQGSSIGQVVRIDDIEGTRVGSEQYAYDNMSRPILMTKCLENTCQTIETTFDRAVRLKTITYPDGQQVVYNYDSAGRLFNIPGIINAISYNSRSQQTTTQFPNRLVESNFYHPTRHWIATSLLWELGRPPPLYREAYTYDAAGRLKTQITDNGRPLDRKFVYDDLNRLRSVSSTADPTQNQSFTYDAIGNMTFNSGRGKIRL